MPITIWFVRDNYDDSSNIYVTPDSAWSFYGTGGIGKAWEHLKYLSEPGDTIRRVILNRDGSAETLSPIEVE